MAVNTIGMESNSRLAYDMGSEHHLTTISKLGGHGEQLDKEINICCICD